MLRGRTPLLWSVTFGVVYLLGAARTPQWADASKLTLYALTAHFPSWNPGDHPGWTVLAWFWLQLFPGNPALACHLLSGLLASISVGLLATLLQWRHHPPGVVNGTVLVWGLAHGPWWSAEITETYSLAFTLVLATYLAFEKRQQVLVGFFAGLGVATHGLTIFLTAPVLSKSGGLRIKLLAFILGSSPIWLAGLMSPHFDPLTGFLSGGLTSVSWHWRAFFSLERFLRGTLVLLALLGLNAGPIGAWAWFQSGPISRSGLWPCLFLGFFLPNYAFFRLHLMVAFLFLALLLWRPPQLRKRQLVAHALCQLAIYLMGPPLLKYLNVNDLGVRVLPGRDNATYFLNPIKSREKSAATYTQGIFSKSPEGAVLIADFNPGATLKLRQVVEGLRPDLYILPSAVDNTLATTDPPAALGALVRSWLAKGKKVVLADSYEPYYHLEKLRAQGFLSKPCGPGVLIELKPSFQSQEKWRADRDSNPEPSDP